jgi:predicted metal-dependent peptidase
VAAARLWATQQQPYLASALLASPVLAAPGLGTVTIDERWRLHADPEVVERWAAQELGTVLIHHVGHVLREHAGRAAAAGVAPATAERWVRAADAEINDDLVEAGLLPPGADDLPSSFGAEDGRLAEEYFDHLGRMDEQDEQTCCSTGPAGGDADPDDDGGDGDGDGDGGGRDDDGDRGRDDDGGRDDGAAEAGPRHECGSGAHGQPRPWEAQAGDAAPPGLPPGAADLLRRAVAHDVAAHAATHPGTVPGGWLRWAQQLLEPKVDWRRALAAEVRRGRGLAQGRVDYSYRRPGRRQAALPDVVLPSLHQPVPEVAVIVDTSGSMGTAELTSALSEVEGVLQATAGRGRLRVLAVDADVHATTRVRRAAEVRLAGGGGTDLRVGLAAVAELRPRVSLVVVVTDGFTPWPDQPPPGAHVVVALINGDAAPAPPAWARAVTVPT